MMMMARMTIIIRISFHCSYHQDFRTTDFIKSSLSVCSSKKNHHRCNHYQDGSWSSSLPRCLTTSSKKHYKDSLPPRVIYNHYFHHLFHHNHCHRHHIIIVILIIIIITITIIIVEHNVIKIIFVTTKILYYHPHIQTDMLIIITNK